MRLLGIDPEWEFQFFNFTIVFIAYTFDKLLAQMLLFFPLSYTENIEAVHEANQLSCIDDLTRLNTAMIKRVCLYVFFSIL